MKALRLLLVIATLSGTTAMASYNTKDVNLNGSKVECNSKKQIARNAKSTGGTQTASAVSAPIGSNSGRAVN